MTKSVISRQNPRIGTGTKSGYRYPMVRGKVVPVPQSGTSTHSHKRVGTGTDASSSLDFYIRALISPKFVLR